MTAHNCLLFDLDMLLLKSLVIKQINEATYITY